MKVEIVQTLRLHPELEQSNRQAATLPVIDSWGSYWRTLVPIYLFDAYSGQGNLHSELFQSISRTLNVFPQLAGTLEPFTLHRGDGNGQSLQRSRVIWGGNTPGGQFIEARTRVRIRSLLPRSVHNASSFLWDRADESLRPLFPQTYPAHSGLRVQVTSFRCGGFGIALDFDHGLADAYTVGLFMQHWSAVHNQIFAQEITSAATIPNVLFSPQFVEEKLPKTDEQGGPDKALLQKARELPTRRPDRRSPDNIKNDATAAQISTARPPSKPSAGVPYLLHLSALDYERITRKIQDEATVQITDQVAFISFLWASLNRARARTPGRPSLDLHLALSFRWLLGLPDGLLGSPLIAVMMNGSKEGESYTDAVKLAVDITETLDMYDEDALLATTYDASLRNSPTSIVRSAEWKERMEFTSGVGFGSSNFSFGSHSPVFAGPIFLPVDNLFIMAEGIPDSSSTVSSKWYKYGTNVFFSLPQDILQALLADPAFAGLELLSDS
jgi:Transferase family